MQAISTAIIMGFLGVGKTSAILNLFNAESGRMTLSRLSALERAAVEILGVGLDAEGLEPGLNRCLAAGFK